ncbi:MAG: hypothetical protein IPG05_10040 [Gemmatimonadetes bacterium]|nr:hypothetical protein [Gemmatimonadota bacterium]
MSTPDDLHTPTPAFVAGLEEAVLRAYREADAIPVIPRAPSTRWRDWGRIAAVLLLGAALGIGGQFASAQVRDAKTRSEIERSVMAERELQSFRLELAKQEVKRIDAAVRLGGMPARALMEATREQRVGESAVQRLDLDLAEVRLSNAPPRNELSAPLVGGRDFVLERLRLRAPLALREEDGALRLAFEADRRVKLGLDPECCDRCPRPRRGCSPGDATCRHAASPAYPVREGAALPGRGRPTAAAGDDADRSGADEGAA